MDGILTKVDEMLKKEDADLFQIEAAIAQAKDLYPNDPGVETRVKQLRDKQAQAAKKLADQQNRKRFDGLLKAVDDILAKAEPDLDDAQAKLESAKELFPDDAKLRQLLADISAKRKDKIVKDISAALAKGDLIAADKQIKEAEANYPGDYLMKVKAELEQEKKDAQAKPAPQP